MSATTSVISNAKRVIVKDTIIQTTSGNQYNYNVQSNPDAGKLNDLATSSGDLCLGFWPIHDLSTVQGSTESFFFTDNESLRQAIASWLSSLNFQVSQTEFIQKRKSGTGNWLLESQEFQDWCDGTSQMLWCPGDGKIISLSRSIDSSSQVTEQLVLERLSLRKNV